MAHSNPALYIFMDDYENSILFCVGQDTFILEFSHAPYGNNILFLHLEPVCCHKLSIDKYFTALNQTAQACP